MRDEIYVYAVVKKSGNNDYIVKNEWKRAESSWRLARQAVLQIKNQAVKMNFWETLKN